MEEEGHIAISQIEQLHASVRDFFVHQRDHGSGLRTQELEAAAIQDAQSSMIHSDSLIFDKILRLAILSGSARLVACLPKTHSSTYALSLADWQDHFEGTPCARREDRVAATIAAIPRGLAIYNSMGPIFAQARHDPAWKPLLAAIASQTPCFGCFMYPDQDTYTEGSAEDLAAFLRRQVECFPQTAAESVESASSGGMHALLGLLLLLPIDPNQILRKGVKEDHQGLIDRLSSNHGRLQIRAALGTLEDALADIFRFRARVTKALPELGRPAGGACEPTPATNNSGGPV